MPKLIDILKTNKIIRISPEDNLSSALGKLTTSHDAGFVFGEKGKYLGVINPYYCLIKTSFPGNAKVSHCLFHAPHVKVNFPISKVANLFIESKVHYLPVFDDKDEFKGIISARRILDQIKNNYQLKVKIGSLLKDKKRALITIGENDLISKAVSIFKQTKVSKLVVTDQNKKLKGVLSYYDLINGLIAPKKSPHLGERTGSNTNVYHMKVKNFSKSFVLTLSTSDTLDKVLDMILEKKIGSVVVIDNERRPIGIVTTKDILRQLIDKEKKENFELATKNISNQSRKVVKNFIQSVKKITAKIPNLTKTRLFVKEEKDGNLFRVVLSLFPKKGDPVVISREGKKLDKTMKETIANKVVKEKKL